MKKRFEVLKNDKKKLLLLFLLPSALALFSFAIAKEAFSNDTKELADNKNTIPESGILPVPEESNPDTVTFDKSALYETENHENIQKELDSRNQVSDQEAFEIFLNTAKQKQESKQPEKDNPNSLYSISKKNGGSGNKNTSQKPSERVEITPANSYLSTNEPIVSSPPSPSINSPKRRSGPSGTTTTKTSFSKTSIGAVIHNWNKEIRNNSTVRIRTTEAFLINGIDIPVNTILSGTASLNQDRLKITITSVNFGGQIINVELLVFDQDGGEGLNVPSSLASDIAGSAADKGLDETKTNLKIPVVGDFSISVGKKAKENPSISVPDGYKIILKPKR